MFWLMVTIIQRWHDVVCGFPRDGAIPEPASRRTLLVYKASCVSGVAVERGDPSTIRSRLMEGGLMVDLRTANPPGGVGVTSRKR